LLTRFLRRATNERRWNVNRARDHILNKGMVVDAAVDDPD
jgi:hypothetical protein